MGLLSKKQQSLKVDLLGLHRHTSPADHVHYKPPGTPTFRKWASLVVMSLALAIIVIDTTLLNVSLGPIIRDLHTDIQSIQWVITLYALILSAFTITGGRFGDFFGRKRMFMLGAAIFAVGSFVASISTTVPMLIVGEAIIEGIGAALMMPATASLLVATFQGRERAIAFGVWGGIAAAAASAGPILGGWLTTAYSWRWGFRINVVVAAILILGSVLVKESWDREEKREIDWLGILFSATGLLAVVFGIIQASTYGWIVAKQDVALGGITLLRGGLSVVPLFLLVGALLLGAFLLWEMIAQARGRTPLVSLRLFSNGQFTSGVVTTAILSLGQSGIFFILPVFLQAVRGLDALHTGYALLPMTLSLLLVAPLSVVLSKRTTPKRLIQIGLFIDVVALLVLRAALTVDATVWTLAPGLILYGIGMGLVMAQISNMTLSAVSVQEAGEASGVNNTLRQLGSTLGSAIIGTVLLGTLSTNLAMGIRQSTVIPDVAKEQMVSVVAEQTSNVEFAGGAHTSQGTPPEITAEIVRIGHEATTQADRTALLYTTLFAALAFLVSFKLPNVRNLERGTSVAAGH